MRQFEAETAPPWERAITMTQEAKLQAFEAAFAAVTRAHRRHAAILTAAEAGETSRSRRALYNAIKDYRRAETDLFHAASAEKENLSVQKDENACQSAMPAAEMNRDDGCHNTDT